MKYGKILLFWFLALPVSIAMRLIQLFFTVESDTGFFKQGLEGFGNAITLIIVAFAAVGIFFGLISHRSPEEAPRKNVAVSVLSLGAAVVAFYELATLNTAAFGSFWQIPLLKVTAVMAIIFFILYAFSMLFSIKVAKFAFVLPVIYFIAKIMCDFTSIAALALISDNILYLAALCSSLVFFLQFAKLYMGYDTERNFRKILASGIAASIFCLTQSIPHIIYNIATSGGYSHLSKAANYSLFITGGFILTFILVHFKAKSRR